MCGNGVRMVARKLQDGGLDHRRHAWCSTPAPARSSPSSARATRSPSTWASPASAARSSRASTATASRSRCNAAGRSFTFTFVDVGNPHAIIQSPWPLELVPLHEVGPVIEEHKYFPRKANVEFVKVARRARRQGPRVGAGRGGDAGLRHRRHRHGRRARAHRPVHEPGHRGAARAASSSSRSGRDWRVFMTGPAEEIYHGDLSREFLGPPRVSRSRRPAPRRTMRIAERVRTLPPYLFAAIERQIAERARRRHRRHQPRHRRSRTCPRRRTSSRRWPRRPPTRRRTSTRATRASPASARRWPGSTRRASASSSTRPTEIVPLLGAKEGIAHLCLALLDPGDAGPGRRPRLPGLRHRPAARRRRAPCTCRWCPSSASSPTSRPSRPRRSRKAKMIFVSYPNNPTGAVIEDDFFARLVAFAKAQRHRRRARQRLRRHHLRRLRGAELPGDAGRQGRRRRDVQPLQELQHDRLARRRHRRQPRGRRRLLAPQDQHRLRHVRRRAARRARRRSAARRTASREMCRIYQRRRDLLVEALRTIGMHVRRRPRAPSTCGCRCPRATRRRASPSRCWSRRTSSSRRGPPTAPPARATSASRSRCRTSASRRPCGASRSGYGSRGPQSRRRADPMSAETGRDRRHRRPPAAVVFAVVPGGHGAARRGRAADRDQGAARAPPTWTGSPT